MVKIFVWLKVNLASILAAVQIIIKSLKELITAIVNLISIFMPVVVAEKIVMGVRTVLNFFDDRITKIKDKLIPIIGG